jgi:outer membrane lipoprotein-sorting protein
MNILRRLSISRLLLLCALVLAIGVSATAIAFAVGSGPTPPPKPLAQAIRDALAGNGGKSVQGLSANIQFTDHLLEGASLASGEASGGGGEGEGGGLTSSPLVEGAAGRLWIDKEGHARLELQSEQGDTEVLYDGHTLQLYDAATNTLYRYTPPPREAHGDEGEANAKPHEPPSVAKIEQAISRLSEHADVSAAAPSDVAGQPAYTVRVSPKESGSLFGGAELSWDANNGLPLRTAVYSSATSTAVIELAASEVSFGPVESSVFAFTPPAGAKVEEVSIPHDQPSAHVNREDGERPHVTTRGHGANAIVVLASSRDGENNPKSSDGKNPTESLGELPKVTISGTSARELRTELGTLLTFERSGVDYVLAGAVDPAAVEEVARGL